VAIFLLHFAHLFVPLATPNVGCTSAKQRKTNFSLVFRSVCTTFAHEYKGGIERTVTKKE
jgi:hypothetical protein